jgi:hypothetical protein
VRNVKASMSSVAVAKTYRTHAHKAEETYNYTTHVNVIKMCPYSLCNIYITNNFDKFDRSLMY